MLILPGCVWLLFQNNFHLVKELYCQEGTGSVNRSYKCHNCNLSEYVWLSSKVNSLSLLNVNFARMVLAVNSK